MHLRPKPDHGLTDWTWSFFAASLDPTGKEETRRKVSLSHEGVTEKKIIYIYISTTGRSSVKRTSTYAGLPSIQIINENKWSNRKQGRWRFGPADWSRSFGLCSDVFPQDHCCFIDHRSITLFTPYCHTVTVTARERKSQLELIIFT